MADISKYYEEHSELVYHYLYKLSGSGDLAEELTQETFYQAIRTVGRYRGECKPSVWLCQIARHCWYKYLEKHRHEKSFSPIDENIPAECGELDERIIDGEDKMHILAEMQKLDGTVREIMYLRILGELSFKEIGVIVGQSENTVRVTYFRGKRKILESCR